MYKQCLKEKRTVTLWVGLRSKHAIPIKIRVLRKTFYIDKDTIINFPLIIFVKIGQRKGATQYRTSLAECEAKDFKDSGRKTSEKCV